MRMIYARRVARAVATGSIDSARKILESAAQLSQFVAAGR
jgi:hypothetical protein